jgi:hypothetical protein
MEKKKQNTERLLCSSGIARQDAGPRPPNDLEIKHPFKLVIRKSVMEQIAEETCCSCSSRVAREDAGPRPPKDLGDGLRQGAGRGGVLPPRRADRQAEAHPLHVSAGAGGGHPVPGAVSAGERRAALVERGLCRSNGDQSEG